MKAKPNSAPNGNGTLATGWYGPGWDGGYGYFNPVRTPEYNPYPYYNIVGGEPYGPLYEYDLPDQNESPFNPAVALTRHSGAASASLHGEPNYITGAARPIAWAGVIRARKTKSFHPQPSIHFPSRLRFLASLR